MSDPVIAERCSLGQLTPDNLSNGFLQSPFWARQKAAFGWKAEAVNWRRGGESGTLLILIKSLPAGLALAYVPGGPAAAISAEDREGFLEALSRELRGILPLGCFFIRWDLPEFSADSTGSGELSPPPSYPDSLKKAPLDIQPPDTVVLNLREGYEALLPGMHKKHRYNIRLAEKKGVVVEACGIERLKEWYELYRITAERDRIGIHPYRYYENLFQEIGAESGADAPKLTLYLASHENDLLAGIIVLFNGKEAVYLYGASSNEKRNLMPAYALQARAISDACEAGCEEYDLYGCPPSADPDHPMAGLYRFKTGFGGELRHRAGAWDYPYSRLFYAAYRLLEAGRRWYYKVWKKR